MGRVIACIAGAALLVCAAANAERHPIQVWMDECMEESPTTQGCTACAREGQSRWQRELETADRLMRGRLSGPARERYGAFMEAWKRHREVSAALNEHIYIAVLTEIDGNMWTMLGAVGEMEAVRIHAEYLDALSLLLGTGPKAPRIEPDDITDEDRKAGSNVIDFYGRLAKTLDASAKPLLDRSRRAWQTYRDRRLAFLEAFYGDQSSQAAAEWHVMQVNREHAEYLRGLIADLSEGGLGQPVPLPWRPIPEEDGEDRDRIEPDEQTANPQTAGG